VSRKVRSWGRVNRRVAVLLRFGLRSAEPRIVQPKGAYSKSERILALPMQLVFMDSVHS
jgi:hypothetical protein